MKTIEIIASFVLNLGAVWGVCLIGFGLTEFLIREDILSRPLLSYLLMGMLLGKLMHIIINNKNNK